MAAKTTTKTNRNVQASTRAPTTKATKKNATVAKPAAKDPKPATKKLSQIEAAVAILANSKQPTNCIAMVEAIQVDGLWASPCGATPDATLYASILREINTKAKVARIKKVDRGLFALATRK